MCQLTHKLKSYQLQSVENVVVLKFIFTSTADSTGQVAKSLLSFCVHLVFSTRHKYGTGYMCFLNVDSYTVNPRLEVDL